ncbi:macrophage mannose receptor 1 isoform X1 [Labeo rohita]|uniref:macrophage mannose receptor 1 isoform X1 n=1 Tax=Labeo rohita TaxID=84645 RepID=UPI0021E28B83|nr:macrophage mannose receptor 1 isoform X1 [Labeo rohita]
MDRLFQLLFFSGFCSFTGGISREYVLIQEQKTWKQAQAYCRENHIDLATVQSDEDWANLREAVQVTKKAWIGLFNDINSWRWSYQNKEITFSSWSSGEPNNYGGYEACGLMQGRTWNDYNCNSLYPFICFEENGTNKFVFINNSKNWLEAQHYCRQYYTDLVIIQNQTELNEMTVIMKPYTSAWIGAFRDVWKWSDATNVSTSSFTRLPLQSGLSSPCGVSDSVGIINYQDCTTVLPFLCMHHKTETEGMGDGKGNKRDMESSAKWICVFKTHTFLSFSRQQWWSGSL